MRTAGREPGGPDGASWCLLPAALLTVAALVPPALGLARRYELVQAAQFSLFALVVPALVTVGLPWRRIGLGSGSARARPVEPSLAERLGAARRPDRLFGPSVAALGPFVVLVVAWRTPVAVDALVRHPWLIGLEGASLLVSGVVLWSVLVDSGPRLERPARPLRAALAALAMWTVWILAYVLGFSGARWYPAFPHAGLGLSVPMDQQLSTFVLWFFAAVSFVPVVFRNMMVWLRGQDDAGTAPYRGAAGTA